MYTILLGVMGGVGTNQSPNSKTHCGIVVPVQADGGAA